MKILRKIGLAVLSAICCLGIFMVILGFVLIGLSGEMAFEVEE